jgi:threonine dehydratase
MSISLDDITAARNRISKYIRRTPLAQSPWLSEMTGGQILLKVESLQTTGSFKLRGAVNALASLLERSEAAAPRVVTASAGNHGRAMAWAAERLGVELTVFTSNDAPKTKRDGIRRHGADLRDAAPTYDEAEQLAKTFAIETGATYISPYSHPDIIAGAGTVALEVLEEAPNMHSILVPTGGGGLLSGIAIATKAVAPGAQVVGVELEVSHPFRTSLTAGRIAEITVGETIADGLSGNLDPTTITFALVKKFVDNTVVVSEDGLRRGIYNLVANEQLIAEGAGIAAVAALLEGTVNAADQTVVAIVSGANIDVERLTEILSEG